MVGIGLYCGAGWEGQQRYSSAGDGGMTSAGVEPLAWCVAVHILRACTHQVCRHILELLKNEKGYCPKTSRRTK